jgi:hypothetical protein
VDKKSKYPSQTLTNDDIQILDQIIIKYAVKFYALIQEYPNPKKYAERVIRSKMLSDTNIAFLYAITYVRNYPSDYIYKPGQLNETLANDIRNTITESYPTLDLEHNNQFKGFLNPRDLRERVLKKLEKEDIFIHLEGKNKIRSQENKMHRPGRKSSSDEVHNGTGGKQSAYIITDEVEKLKKAIESPEAIDYLYEKIINSNLAFKFAKFNVLAFLHAAKLDEISTQKLLDIGAAMMQDNIKEKDDSIPVFLQRLQFCDDRQLEQYVDEAAQFLTKERDYYALLSFMTGLLKI